nr:unnamed protein product [Digitaria exilis]
MRVLVVHRSSDIQHNRSSKHYDEKSCEVHQQGFRAVPAKAAGLKEDDKPRANVPWKHSAPDCWRSTREEEGCNAK